MYFSSEVIAWPHAECFDINPQGCSGNGSIGVGGRMKAPPLSQCPGMHWDGSTPFIPGLLQRLLCRLWAGGAPVLTPASCSAPPSAQFTSAWGKHQRFPYQQRATFYGEPRGLLDYKSFEMFKYGIFPHTTETISILISLALWSSTWILSQGYMAKPPLPHLWHYYLMLIFLLCLPLSSVSAPVCLSFFFPSSVLPQIPLFLPIGTSARGSKFPLWCLSALCYNLLLFSFYFSSVTNVTTFNQR